MCGHPEARGTLLIVNPGNLFAVLGIGFLWLAQLMRTERLPRNPLVGMRTRATMADDRAWKAAHRASTWSVAVAGVVLLAAGAWLLLDRESPQADAKVVLVTTVVLLAVVVAGGVQADRVARRTGASGR